MELLLNEIDWSEPVLPPVHDPAWEADVKREGGQVGEIHRRIAPNPWLRGACLRLSNYRVSHMPVSLMDLGALVTSQENACRYCYGTNRAYMRILGYPERKIAALERQAQLAELDPKERAFVHFCRTLARSKPRPTKAELDGLVALGYSPLAVREMAAYIAMGCFLNRVATLIACPPETEFERFADSVWGRLLGLAGPLFLRPRANRKRSTPGARNLGSPLPPDTPFRPLIEALDGLPAADELRTTLEGALDSTVLPRRTKLLMFAVVGRALNCSFCQAESQARLASEGLSPFEVDTYVSALGSANLEPHESHLMSWVRDTVHLQPAPVQKRTHELRVELGEAALLEAIGVAALANSVVRLAMLLE